jgi:hypothetical protein
MTFQPSATPPGDEVQPDEHEKCSCNTYSSVLKREICMERRDGLEPKEASQTSVPRASAAAQPLKRTIHQM